MKCLKCASGPAGIEGHDDLFSISLNTKLIQFRCQSCGAFWDRQYAGDGRFSWGVRGSDHPGVPLPSSGRKFPG
jgi:hypothetical protein